MPGSRVPPPMCPAQRAAANRLVREIEQRLDLMPWGAQRFIVMRLYELYGTERPTRPMSIWAAAAATLTAAVAAMAIAAAAAVFAQYLRAGGSLPG